MDEIPDRVCILGAGSSGIATCKVLKDHDIPYDCYEASDRIGGNWAYDNPNIFLAVRSTSPRFRDGCPGASR